MYASNICKPKLLNNEKLKFPLPKIKTFPLKCLNLYEEISKKDVNIKNMGDDLNITEEKFFIDLKKINYQIFNEFDKNITINNYNKASFINHIILF